MTTPTTRHRPFDILRLLIASTVSSATVDPSKSSSLAESQNLMQQLAAQLTVTRLAYQEDKAMIELLGLPLTVLESTHISTTLWKLASLPPLRLPAPPPAPTVAPSGALPPLESLPKATAIPAFQQRVIDERQALVEKIDKLGPFIGSDIYNTLPTEEQSRLQSQLNVMNDYASILGDRIQAFGATAEPLASPTMPPPEGAPLIEEAPRAQVPIMPDAPNPTPKPSDPNDAPRGIATPDRDASVGMGEKTPQTPQGEAGASSSEASSDPAPVAAPPETAPIPPEPGYVPPTEPPAPATVTAPVAAAEASSSSSAPSSQPAV